nr:putative ribonuclease H-like domain-containing protein [Tanacetum cinerariifolium]
IESQRVDKNKEGLGYSVVPPPPAQIYSSSKKDLSWTVTDYSRPSPTMESTSGNDQNRNPSVSETVASPITPKPFIKFVKPKDSLSKSKTDETETPKKPPVKKRVKKSFIPKPIAHKPYRPPVRTNMNGARPNRTSFNKQAHSYANKPFHRTSAVRSHYRAPWVSTVNRNFPPINRKFSTGSKIFPLPIENFPLLVENFPLVAQNIPLLIWESREKLSQNNINDKGYWDSGGSRHMTGNISYLSDYEPFDGGYMSFGQGGCKITGKGTIKTSKLEFENVYFLKDLKYNLFSVSQLCDNKNSVLFTDLECIMLGRDFKLLDDANILLRTPRQHNMRLGHLNFKTMNKLVRHNLVRGLPTKCFENDHTCTACLKGKQHKAYCKSKVVNSVTKPLHTLHMDLFGPTSNSVAERRNRTLIEVARIMLADAKLLVTFWAEAVNTACYVQNRVLVSKSYIKTPYELFNGRSPAIGFLKPFGCYVLILNTLYNLGKFEEKGDKGYFIGYSMPSKAFRVFNKRTRRVEENLHVEFLENKAIKKGVGPNWLFDIDSLTKSVNYVPVDAGTISTNISGTKDATSQEVKKNVSFLRYIALPNWAHDALLESSSSKPQDHCSTKVPEGSGNLNPTAFTSNLSANPMEILTVESLIPITLVNCPKEVRPIGTKWVLKNKKDERGIVIRNKARLVAQGHTQEEWINYDEVFAPVARIKAIRLFLAYASFMGFTVYQMDVKSAFLYGTIDEEVGDFILVQVYVDDIIFGSSNPQLCREFEALMHEKFQMSAMGELNFFLGFQVLQKEDGIFLSQDKYVGDILKKFGYSDVRSSNTPMDKDNPWGKDGTGKDVDLHLYRSMIRSLMHLTASRPDIMFDVCTCARHQVTPKECHVHAVKRIFRYLKGHPKLGLWYPKESPFDLVAYSDSHYGGATQDRKSTTGGCRFLGRRLISQQCKKQTIVATSKTKEEYVAAASCCGQVLLIQN